MWFVWFLIAALSVYAVFVAVILFASRVTPGKPILDTLREQYIREQQNLPLDEIER